MKKAIFLFAIALLSNVSTVFAQSGLNIHIGAGGIDVQPDAFVSYYQAPSERVVWLRQENIPQDQWPLVFEIARASNTSPERVWEIRRHRSSWYEVISELNVPPSYFYYEGYSRPRRGWSDGDFVRLASVKYISGST